MMTTLKEEIVEIKGELTIYMAIVGNRGLVVAPKPNVDVPKLKEFNRRRPVRDVENFLWGMESTDLRRGVTENGT
ncbi:hypothetical protein PVK06_048571 [Gossypium arboreum]|uniref:Uncharacterized protein n=1 Tax=Gossypium arboreum TaxID=29729 RepID=A0ABR0MG86_GOSAR|nr:hypothetical protein PVK06_048571 [Gossypium arboreum]